MARVRFIGPEPHTVPLLGRDVQPDELVEVPGVLIERLDGGWLLGDPQDDPDDPRSRYVLPATLWTVEDEPKPAKALPPSAAKVKE